MRWPRALSLIGLSLLMASPLFAEPTTDPVDDAIMQYQLDGAIHKLGRGTENTLMGWVELPLNIEREYSSQRPVTTFTVGLTKGLIKGVVRMGVGLYEVVTCLIPYPEHFAPVLPPLQYHQPDPPLASTPPGQEPLAP